MRVRRPCAFATHEEPSTPCARMLQGSCESALMDMQSLQLEIAAADALDGAARAEIIALCEAAYGEGFARLFEELPGSVHVLARDERGSLVSHAEWVTRWLQPAGLPLLRTAYVEAVATAPARQRQGLGTAVLRHLTRIVAMDSTWQLSALSPSDPAFYERSGWELWRGPLAIRREGLLERTPPDEQVMIYRLPGTPARLDTTSQLTAEWRRGELW
jgi:aminoglycoside 2'-N-acetyltransferase I